MGQQRAFSQVPATLEPETQPMLPNPLHPAIVHFPLVLAFLFPLFAAAGVLAIRRGAVARRAWLLPTAFAIAVAGSAWLSVQTGEAQGERVERVVGEQPMESHEEVAEAFLAMSVAVAGIAMAGLIAGFAGQAARMLTMVGSLALIGMAIRVGHTGGQLVYRHGAANAYTAVGTPAATPRSRAIAEEQ